MTIGMMAGHIAVNSYLERIGARGDLLCDGCDMGSETALHFLCKCLRWPETWTEIYGADNINPAKVLENDLKAFFIRQIKTSTLIRRLFRIEVTFTIAYFELSSVYSWNKQLKIYQVTKNSIYPYIAAWNCLFHTKTAHSIGTIEVMLDDSHFKNSYDRTVSERGL